MLNGLNAAERANAPLLFRMLAELEFDLDRLDVALNILLSMADDVPRREYRFLPRSPKLGKC
jgi:hypothetical protein